LTSQHAGEKKESIEEIYQEIMLFSEILLFAEKKIISFLVVYSVICLPHNLDQF
jgi:hypothetical protein